MLTNSLKTVHDAYGPKGRNIADSVREMREQALHVQSYVEKVATAEVRQESADSMKKIAELTDAIEKLASAPPAPPRPPPPMPPRRASQIGRGGPRTLWTAAWGWTQKKGGLYISAFGSAKKGYVGFYGSLFKDRKHVFFL